MSTIRKMRGKWQSIIRIQGHPLISKTFVAKTDAQRWAQLTEVKLRREDAGILKIKYHFDKSCLVYFLLQNIFYLVLRVLF